MGQEVVKYCVKKTPDYQYTDAVGRILNGGCYIPTSNQGEPLLVHPGVRFEYDLRNGVPLNTQRSLRVTGPDGWAIWRHAVGEICAFLNGMRTIAGLHRFGCWFWDKWGTSEMCVRNNLPVGDLGAFYGKVWTDFNGVNQIDRLMRRLKTERYAKHHRVANWNPPEVETDELGFTMPCRPCHGDWQVVIYQVDGVDQMDLMMTQRSGDLPIGVPFNTFQYAVLLLALSAITGCRAGRFVHLINHCHIYHNQIPAMEEFISREPRPFPEVEFVNGFDAITDIRELRRKHVDLVPGTYDHYPPLEYDLPVLL